MLSNLTSKLYALILFSGCFGLHWAQAAMPPADWLDDMHYAIHHLNYAGRFIYQVGPDVATINLQRQGHGEHLHSLNGRPYEIVRGQNSWDTQVTSEQSTKIPGLLPQQHVIGLNCLFNYRQMMRHYQVQLGAQHRVAGRMTQIIDIQPTDALRFGRRLYLDQATKLPLRSVLLDHAGKPLAQTLFVDFQLQTGESVKKTSAKPMQPALNRQTAGHRWRFEPLPAGFDMMLHQYQKPVDREHFIFSDGLSMVSVYLEPWSNDGMLGFSKQGATWILGARKYNRRATLLGEVPKVTLQRVADAIQPVRK